jgi:micrococcal nuclease
MGGVRGRLRAWLGVVALLSLLVAVSTASGEDTAWVRVRWVADGDTIVLEDGRHVRYIGLDCPEIDHANHRATPLGVAARDLNRKLVEGSQLRLVFDRDRFDRYGRTLAYVHRRDGRFINAELLEQGYAWVLPRYPNFAQAQALLAVQRVAMQAGRGLWRFVDAAEAPARPYVGNRRSKRFHAPGCPNGAAVSPTHRVAMANRWQAFWSGYAPAKGCLVFPPVIP